MQITVFFLFHLTSILHIFIYTINYSLFLLHFYTMQLTIEQQAVINTNGNVVINAVAGSGKTTTLVAYAKSRPANSNILYIAFNKTVKTAAQEKFATAGVKNITIETAHSLAFNYIIKNSNYKVGIGYKSHEWIPILGIQTGEKNTDYVIANHVNKFITYFCNSHANKVQELQYTDVISDPKAKLFVTNFYDAIEKYTRLALAKMYKAEIDITHDFYLKQFQLSNPTLPYHYILFDEGQDASAAMLQVFLQQKAIKVIVGDVHQQIYGWRYAVNSLQQVNFPIYYLSTSFRFDDEVALIANKVLNWKNKHLGLAPAVKVIGSSTTNNLNTNRATLGRTNLCLLLNAIAQWQSGTVKKIYFEGNISSYTFAEEGASLYDVLHLYNSKKDKIKDALIASMDSIKALEEYIEKTEDNSLRMIVDVVKEFGNKLPNLIETLKENHTTNKKDADMIFSTVHRCKGMEYNEVFLLKDFITEEKIQKQLTQIGIGKLTTAETIRLTEEVNLLYVAATRAINKLIIPIEINPLKSIVFSNEYAITLTNTRSKYVQTDDWDLYNKTENAKAVDAIKNSKPNNQGKSWNKDETETLESLFYNNESFKDIATALGRSERSIKIKLINMNLLDQDGAF